MRLSIFLTLISISLLSNHSFATNIETLFNLKDPNYYKETVSKTYTNTPIIKIEGPAPIV